MKQHGKRVAITKFKCESSQIILHDSWFVSQRIRGSFELCEDPGEVVAEIVVKEASISYSDLT